MRFATQALTALEATHIKWIKWEKTREAAKVLKPVNDHLQRLTSMLDDATADHYLVAYDLGVIVAQLMLINREEMLKPLMDIASARRKILGELQ